MSLPIVFGFEANQTQSMAIHLDRCQASKSNIVLICLHNIWVWWFEWKNGFKSFENFYIRMKRDRLTMYFDKNFEHFKLSFPLHVLSWKKEHLTQRKLRLQFSVYGALLFLSCLRHTLDEEKKNLLAFWCHTLLFSIRDHCPTLSSVERWLAFQCIYFKVAKHFAISDHSEPYTRIFFSLINSRQVWD